MICSLQQLILNCCSVGFSVFYWFYNKRKPRGTNEMTSEWNYKNLNSARNGPSGEERGGTDVFAGLTRIGEVKTSIDNTTGQRSLFLDSNFFFPTRIALYFSTQISKFRLVFFFSFVNIYFANLDSYFLLHSMYFTSFDLSIMFSTCFYYRYNFVRNGTP